METLEDLKKEYIEHMRQYLPRPHDKAIMEHLENGQVGDWIVEATLAFVRKKQLKQDAIWKDAIEPYKKER